MSSFKVGDEVFMRHFKDAEENDRIFSFYTSLRFTGRGRVTHVNSKVPLDVCVVWEHDYGETRWWVNSSFLKLDEEFRENKFKHHKKRVEERHIKKAPKEGSSRFIRAGSYFYVSEIAV